MRLYSLSKMLYPKRRIQSYSILGTIVSPNKVLLIWGFPKIRGTILGVPRIRTTLFWGLYWGSLI